MIDRYRDIALRLASRLAQRDDLSETDLRVLRAYFALASEDIPEPPGVPAVRPPETGIPPTGSFALLPLALANGKAEGDHVLLALILAVFAYVGVILWRAR